jgi:hypothetical protein
MKPIRTKLHGYLDYSYAILLAVSPWIFGFSTPPDDGPATMIPLILGVLTLIYSLFTDYELGVYNFIPLRVHLFLDIIFGVFLAASPWIFDFAADVWVPHVVFGITAVVVSMLTTTARAPSQTPREHHAAITDSSRIS